MEKNRCGFIENIMLYYYLLFFSSQKVKEHFFWAYAVSLVATLTACCHCRLVFFSFRFVLPSFLYFRRKNNKYTHTLTDRVKNSWAITLWLAFTILVGFGVMERGCMVMVVHTN